MSSKTLERSTRLVLMALRQEQDVVLCRNRARAIAAALQFDRQCQVRIATAVSEIARNAFRYGQEATVEFSIHRGRTGDDSHVAPSFVTVVRDKGPGIEDLPSILAGTYQPGTGLGMGILGAKRLMNVVDIETGSNGTTVRLAQKLPTGVEYNSLDLRSIAEETSRRCRRCV